MKTRNISLLLSIVAPLQSGVGIAAEVRPSAKPNIVVVLADDMGYADVPGFGENKEIPMPALDRLAREGVRFTDAY